VLATRLKQTMLLMNPAFNEANFGYPQFRYWLEVNQDLAKLFLKDLQLYVAPLDFSAPGYDELPPAEAEQASTQSAPKSEKMPPVRTLADGQYRQLFARLKMDSVDLATRRDVLRDVYRELSEKPGIYTTNDLIDLLQERYEAQSLQRNKAMLRDIMQLAFRQGAFEYFDQEASPYGPVKLAPGLDSEAAFVERAESDLIYTIVRAGVDLDLNELAYLVLNDRSHADYIQLLLDDLKKRGLIAYRNKRYVIPGRGNIPFAEDPALRILSRDIEQAVIPDHSPEGVEAARTLAKKAMVQRSQDFAASSSTYLLACRLQWDAVEKDEPGATLEDLRWYLASYASAIAGKLSQVNRDYTSARPYYIAFFSLVQEDDPLWGRMRGLINPMLAYYWSNTGRELDINVSAWNLSMSSPAQIAVYAATHPNPDLRKLWYKTTVDLAEVNPGVLRRIANQLMLSRSEYPENGRVAEQIEQILEEVHPA
jgi:hypothetical protein